MGKKQPQYTASITLHGHTTQITKEMNDMAKIYHKDGLNHADKLPNDYLKADFLFGLHQALISSKEDIYKIYLETGMPKSQVDMLYNRALRSTHQLFLTAMQYDNGSDY